MRFAELRRARQAKQRLGGLQLIGEGTIRRDQPITAARNRPVSRIAGDQRTARIGKQRRIRQRLDHLLQSQGCRQRLAPAGRQAAGRRKSGYCNDQNSAAHQHRNHQRHMRIGERENAH